mmetsp:Transcript_18088/g.35503  ORF Transcript_18088/g.35503 Transcript_18088/m.35503 type:complete len:598 (+) Transcript_18088:1-1794(+)
MPMGVPMGMTMVPMSMGMGMGMGMMPMMAPMMAMGMNPMLATGLPMQQRLMEAQAQAEQVNDTKDTVDTEERFSKEANIRSFERHSNVEREKHGIDDAAPSTKPTPSSASGSTTAAGPSNTDPAANTSAEQQEGTKETEEEGEPFRCHLHPQRKPNAKCKFCQRAQGHTVQKPAPEPEPKTVKSDPTLSTTANAAKGEFEDYSRRTFNCSPMLKDQIFGSSYFKSLLTINSIEDLIDEIANYADTLDVYNPGSMVSPSCFVCQVYRLFTLPQAEDLGELQAVIDHTDSAVVRCAGFLYMRFVVAPAHLWEKLEEYLFDDMELRYVDGGKQVNTNIGEYIEALLVKDRYFSTPLPRIPMKVRLTLEKELAPLQQYRKRMEANMRVFPRRVGDLLVEVHKNPDWVVGTAIEYVGRSQQRRKVRVRLSAGGDVTVHLGKVVLRETHSDGGESGSEGQAGKRRRSRSRSRGSPDWSRYKGRSDADMVEELRERWKEEAVCGHGKAYSRRPLTVEEELWKREPEVRVSMLGDEARSTYGRAPQRADPMESEATRRRRLAEEDERQKRLRGIYEKYGSASKTESSTLASKSSDMDGPELLRLG